MNRRGVLVVTCVLFVALTQTGAYANDSMVGGIGGSIRPMENSAVRMDAETIQSIVYNGYAHFRVDFRFVNSSQDTLSLKLGFPFKVSDEPEDTAQNVAGFRAWVDGSEIPVTYELGTEGQNTVGYYVHEVRFKPGVSMVRVEYLADMSASSGGADKALKRQSWARDCGTYLTWYDYWVHTGAGWAGTIGATVIRFRMAEDCIGFDPAGATAVMAEWRKPVAASPVAVDDRTLQWVYRDYEPALSGDTRLSPYDVRFSMGTPTYPWNGERAPQELLRSLVETVSASGFLVLGDYRYPAENAFHTVSDAWAEGVEGSGVGEWVAARFGAPRPIEEIRVVSGYAKRPDLFAKYNRPKTLKVTFSDGSATEIHLADVASLQRFEIPARTSSSARVEIIDVYRGTARDETYLSLVDFGKRSPSMETFDQVLADAGVGAPASATGAHDDSGSAVATAGAPAAAAGTDAGSTGSQADSVWLATLLGMGVASAAAGWGTYLAAAGAHRS